MQESSFTRQRRLDEQHIRSASAFTYQALPSGLALLSGDLITVAFGVWIAHALGAFDGLAISERQAPFMFLALWIVFRAYQGLYPGYGRSAQTELRLHTVGTMQVGIVHFATTFAFYDLTPSRLGLGVLWLVLLSLALPVRYAVRALLIRFQRFGRPVSVIGAGQTGALAVRYLKANPGYGLHPIALYDDKSEMIGSTIYGVPILGDIARASAVPLTFHAIVCIPGARAERQREIINAIHDAYPITWATPDLFGVPNQALSPHNIGSVASLEIRNNLRDLRARLVKRIMDVILGSLILVVAAPVLLLIALLVRLDSRGGALYKAQRLGQNREPFSCYKFRTMYENAEERLQELLASDAAMNDEYETYHKLRNDPRITRVGTLLRKYSLDELPQILNVLRGDMSLVGPRPYLLREEYKMGDFVEFVTQVRPGITGYWQVNGRNDSTFEERLDMDCFYITNWTPWLDIVILMQTIKVVLGSKGAY